jgi:hypothetical protein
MLFGAADAGTAEEQPVRNNQTIEVLTSPQFPLSEVGAFFFIITTNLSKL